MLFQSTYIIPFFRLPVLTSLKTYQSSKTGLDLKYGLTLTADTNKEKNMVMTHSSKWSPRDSSRYFAYTPHFRCIMGAFSDFFYL